ncbi:MULTISPECIES: site-specific integrase [unclassified Chryseobacterium]|uniref:site-specific integrase n=1 Tax=unclassified Chryseobacterium TaxID=2593645 RepID=UPI000D3D1C39|nr:MULTISPECIES: site-specific integrase [unclassified Chryseobacterium]MCQ4142561.1 site-specific integrase [Chryseobacterium sp. EO14]PTT69665.1 recombinase [Chryseobacterium sp. HMWF001]PVV59934.1 recombinase [Chryseobacterium sp. HMWF035]
MSTISAILRKKANKQGQYPIYLRITKDRKSTFINLEQYINKSDWDEKTKRVKKSHPNSVRLNNLINKKISEAGAKIIDMDVGVHKQDVKSIRKKLINTDNDFFTVADNYLNNLERLEKYTQLNSDKPRVKSFKSFLNCEKFPLEQITVPLLKSFQTYLIEKKLSQRTITNYLIIIRTIYNSAIRDGIVDVRHYPFGRNKMQIKFPETQKVGLTEEEVKKIENLELEVGGQEWHARNVWLFSFYFAGIRIADVLKTKWSEIQDGRLQYRMNKNQKLVSLKIPDKILVILSYYKKDKTANDDYIFPELKGINKENKRAIVNTTSNADKNLNKYLKRIAKLAEIDKKITMHISRHTFGNISGDKISIQMLQKLYRHSSITTTVNYQSNFIHKDVDDALDSVIGF